MNEYLRNILSFYQELGPRLVFDDPWVWPDSKYKISVMCVKKLLMGQMTLSQGKSQVVNK